MTKVAWCHVRQKKESLSDLLCIAIESNFIVTNSDYRKTIHPCYQKKEGLLLWVLVVGCLDGAPPWKVENESSL